MQVVLSKFEGRNAASIMHNKEADKHTFTIAVMLFATTIVLLSILTTENAFSQPAIPITIIDAVANTNVQVLGETPSMPMGSIYQQQIYESKCRIRNSLNLEYLMQRYQATS